MMRSFIFWRRLPSFLVTTRDVFAWQVHLLHRRQRLPPRPVRNPARQAPAVRDRCAAAADRARAGRRARQRDRGRFHDDRRPSADVARPRRRAALRVRRRGESRGGGNAGGGNTRGRGGASACAPWRVRLYGTATLERSRENHEVTPATTESSAGVRVVTIVGGTRRPTSPRSLERQRSGVHLSYVEKPHCIRTPEHRRGVRPGSRVLE